MKIGKVIVVGSTSTKIKMQGGSAGAIAIVLVGVAGIVGAVKVYQLYADLRKEVEKMKDVDVPPPLARPPG